jgi:hypothetical protein
VPDRRVHPEHSNDETSKPGVTELVPHRFVLLCDGFTQRSIKALLPGEVVPIRGMRVAAITQRLLLCAVAAIAVYEASSVTQLQELSLGSCMGPSFLERSSAWSRRAPSSRTFD